MATSTNTFPLKSYSLEWPYIDESFGNRYWNYGGDTIINLKDQLISLTREVPHQSGWLWSTQQLTGQAWAVDIDFKVHGKAGAFHGDGFAFWYTKGRQTKGPVFGNQDKFEGLGVIFDTFKNGKHDYTFPYVSVQIGDGITGYDFKTDGKSGEAGGCIAADFRNRAFKTVARVEYVAGDYLKVLLNVKGNDQWEECALIKDVTLPSYGYLGFTSHTGAASDRHDIIRVSSNGMTNAKSYAPKKPQQQQQTQQQSARSNKNNNNAKVLRSTGGNLDSQNDGGLFERAFLILMGVFALCLVGVGLCVAYKKVKVHYPKAPKAYNKRI